MGYSFAAVCKSQQAQEHMLSFLEKHYRPWSVLAAGSGCLDVLCRPEDFNNCDWKHTDAIYGPTSALDYDQGKWRIGFNFSSVYGAQREWMTDFCRWVALKVGRVQHFPARLPGIGPVPYVVYDGGGDPDSVWPVLERSRYEGQIPASMDWCLVDDGFTGWDRQLTNNLNELRGALADHLENQRKTARRADEYVKAELKRLSECWRTQDG